jgi:hypothetical protein
MYLYHGSSFLHDDLYPGFHWSKKEIFWDKVESNRFLYASSVREDAVDQGFASALEQRFMIDGYRSTSDGEIIVRLNPLMEVSNKDIELIDIYAYKIKLAKADGWVKNNNPHNNLKTEWKTDHMVPKRHIEATIHIPIGKILVPLIVDRTDIQIRFQKVDLSKMGLESLDFQPIPVSIPDKQNPFYQKWN